MAQPTKTCKMCGAWFSQRPDERYHDFRSRKTCGEECRVRAIVALGHRGGAANPEKWWRELQPWPAGVWYGKGPGPEKEERDG